MDIFDLIDDSNTTHNSPTMKDYNAPSEAELREREAARNAAMMKLFTGDVEDNSGPWRLSTILEHDSWYIPLKSNGEYEFVNAQKGQYDRLINGVSPEDGRRTVEEGSGGQFLPIYRSQPSDAPQGSFKKIDGRTLARELPSKGTGLLVEFGEDDNGKELSARTLEELHREFFEPLRSLATAYDLENVILESDLEINTAELRKAQFRAVIYNKNLNTESFNGGDVAKAMTHEFHDHLNDEVSVEVMSGEELFRRILADESYDGLVINPHIEFGRGATQIKNLLLSLSFAHRALNHDKCYIRVLEPVVRCREEFELWLQQMFFPDPEIFEEVVSGRKMIYAKSKTPYDYWRPQETYGPQGEPAILVTPKMELRDEPYGKKDELAKGTSSILCPGLLASTLYRTARDVDKSKSKPPKWRPGLNVGIGRILSDADIEKSKRRLAIANELLKLLPSDENKIPRTAFLTVAGAGFVRQFPITGTREWIEGTVKEAEANCTKFVIGG